MSKKRKFLLILILIFLFICFVFFILPGKTSDDFSSNQVQKAMKISIDDFVDGERMPTKYTCQGQNIAPIINISEVPSEAKSLLLLVEDPDAPGDIWNHMIIWGIKPIDQVLDLNNLPDNVIVGKNSWGKNNYGGPCPPSGTHRYFFNLYALDYDLKLDKNAYSSLIKDEISGHVLQYAKHMGTYSKTVDPSVSP